MNFSTIFDLCFLLKFFKRGHDYPVTGRAYDHPKYGKSDQLRDYNTHHEGRAFA